MCDRNEVSQSCAQACALLFGFVQELTRKDKALWKGASQGNMQEQGLSTTFVTLVSEQIGFVLVNEGERKEKKRHTNKIKQSCFGSCLDPHPPPKPCLCQVTLV